MTLEDFLQFLRPETLKVMLGDVAQCKDDPDWTVARDVIMGFAASPMLTEDERLRFLRYVPPG